MVTKINVNLCPDCVNELRRSQKDFKIGNFFTDEELMAYLIMTGESPKCGRCGKDPFPFALCECLCDAVIL